jgi:hypothetical protein
MIAIIQRPRRKKHLAVTTPGSDTWDTLGSCRLSIPIDGTDHVSIDGAGSVGTLDAQDVDVCCHCLHLIAFAHVLNRTTNVTLLRGIA